MLHRVLFWRVVVPMEVNVERPVTAQLYTCSAPARMGVQQTLPEYTSLQLQRAFFNVDLNSLNVVCVEFVRLLLPITSCLFLSFASQSCAVRLKPTPK